MGHTINVNMAWPEAKKLQIMGRKLRKDESLGINQAAYALLYALVSGDYILSKKRTPKPKASPAKD